MNKIDAALWAEFEPLFAKDYPGQARLAEAGNKKSYNWKLDVFAGFRLARLTPAGASDDLIERLREYAGNPGYRHNDYADTMSQAADALARPVADNYEKFCKLRDEMGKPRTLGGTFYPKYSEREAFDLAAKDD